MQHQCPMSWEAQLDLLASAMLTYCNYRHLKSMARDHSFESHLRSKKFY